MLGEPARIQLTGFALDEVPGRAGRDHRGIAEGTSQPRDVLVHHVPGAHRRLLTPHRVDQRVDRNDFAYVQEQDAEQRSLAAARQVDTSVVDLSFETSENPEGDGHS